MVESDGSVPTGSHSEHSVSHLLLHKLVIVTLPVSANLTLDTRWAAGSKILLISGPVKIICEAEEWWREKNECRKRVNPK